MSTLPTSEERFWAKVLKTDACWLWQGATDRKGYGHITRDHKTIAAHRYAWGLVNGPVPDGLFMCHRCDNPPCVNPDHLFPGTRAENMVDCVQKGRSAKGDRHGGRRLTELAVRTIRRELPAGASAQALASRYGVHKVTIYDVAKRKNWRHVS